MTASADRPPELADVGKLLRRGVRAAVGAARVDDQVTLRSLLVGHLGGAAVGEVVEETWPSYEHVNVQAGLERWLGEPGREYQLVGVVGFQHRPFGLAELLVPGPPDPYGPRPGSPATMNRASGPDGAVRACVRCGVYLVSAGDTRTALLLRGPEPESGLPQVSLAVVSTDPSAAARTAQEVRAAASAANVFRGQVLSFGQEVFGHGQTLLQFHTRPVLDAAQLVLDEATRRQIERQAVSVARHADRLRAAGQHLKRGLLLYGPPGVGKTHTLRHLTSLLTGTTVVQLTGSALHLIAPAPSRGSRRACEV